VTWPASDQQRQRVYSLHLEGDRHKEKTVKKKDLHENLCKYYELAAGTIPNRDAFIDSIRQTVTKE